MSTPHKSTTHDERFYHVTIEGVEDGTKRGTVFFRKESDGQINASVAVCHAKDQFNRRMGRNVARRKYFQGKTRPVPLMSYDVAEGLLLNTPGVRW